MAAAKRNDVPVSQVKDIRKSAPVQAQKQQELTDEASESSEEGSGSEEGSDEESEEFDTGAGNILANQQKGLDIDDIALLSDNDSENSDYNPTRTSQNLYDLLKFVGVILYQFSLCLTVAYYTTSNFASQYLMGVFSVFFFARPIVILIYCLMSTTCELHKVHHARSTLKTRMHQEVLDLQERKKEQLRKIAGLGSDDESLDEGEVPPDDSKVKAKMADGVIGEAPNLKKLGLGTIFDLDDESASD